MARVAPEPALNQKVWDLSGFALMPGAPVGAYLTTGARSDNCATISTSVRVKFTVQFHTSPAFRCRTGMILRKRSFPNNEIDKRLNYLT